MSVNDPIVDTDTASEVHSKLEVKGKTCTPGELEIATRLLHKIGGTFLDDLKKGTLSAKDIQANGCEVQRIRSSIGRQFAKVDASAESWLTLMTGVKELANEARDLRIRELQGQLDSLIEELEGHGTSVTNGSFRFQGKRPREESEAGWHFLMGSTQTAEGMSLVPVEKFRELVRDGPSEKPGMAHPDVIAYFNELKNQGWIKPVRRWILKGCIPAIPVPEDLEAVQQMYAVVATHFQLQGFLTRHGTYPQERRVSFKALLHVLLASIPHRGYDTKLLEAAERFENGRVAGQRETRAESDRRLSEEKALAALQELPPPPARGDNPAGGKGGAGKGDQRVPRGPTCYTCGMNGHISPKCPNNQVRTPASPMKGGEDDDRRAAENPETSMEVLRYLLLKRQA
jgi:hypothetical protein